MHSSSCAYENVSDQALFVLATTMVVTAFGVYPLPAHPGRKSLFENVTGLYLVIFDQHQLTACQRLTKLQSLGILIVSSVVSDLSIQRVHIQQHFRERFGQLIRLPAKHQHGPTTLSTRQLSASRGRETWMTYANMSKQKIVFLEGLSCIRLSNLLLPFASCAIRVSVYLSMCSFRTASANGSRETEPDLPQGLTPGPIPLHAVGVLPTASGSILGEGPAWARAVRASSQEETHKVGSPQSFQELAM